jgi:hypothetical protein
MSNSCYKMRLDLLLDSVERGALVLAMREHGTTMAYVPDSSARKAPRWRSAS